ncbi:phosphopantetheine-binding protein [uncultured Winogradskyella sp.]|uniref:thioesterase domain-containing protein n=1 Tax=uncultured Winogradskyella sp. TaxID=395353 RepID=UPI002624F332|nr:phosphopantetheine-binding protein [uncultured Winogradskyella sp.]
MRQDILENRLNQLSKEDHQLILLKLKDLVSNTSDAYTTEKPKRLVAYIEANDTFESKEVESFLKKRLPDYMVPSVMHTIPNIPLLPNGKIDRKSLKPVKKEDVLNESSQINTKESLSEIETQLIKIWEDVLNFSPVLSEDNFFEIGGDSILSIQIIAKARKLGLQLTANQLFEYQTIAELSKQLSENKTKDEKEAYDFLVPLREEGSKKPLFCIHSGGGHVVFYNLLAKYMKPNRPIYALEPSGLYGENKMHENVVDMTVDYMKAIQSVQSEGPYNILVYCFSVTVGNEMAIEFSKLGHKANIIVMDTMASPWTLNTPMRLKARMKSFVIRFAKNPFASIKHYFEDRLWRIKPFLVKYFGNEDTRDLELMQENLRKICLAYEFKPHNGDISLILTEKPHQSLQQVIIDSWREITNGDFKLFYTDGNHRTLFIEPDIKFVSQKIEEAIVE